MDCKQVRVALSALIDGEDPPVAADAAARHMAGCLECQAWQARAEQLTRLIRVQPAQVPDLTERVLAATAADAAGHREWTGRRRLASSVSARFGRFRGGPKPGWLRWAVAVVALVQLALALPELLGIPSLHLGHGHALHAGREGASFDIAVAVGFLLAARFPDRARALAPVAVVLALCLTVTSGVDLLALRTTLLHELGHALVLVQAGLLWALGRTGGSGLTLVRPRAA